MEARENLERAFEAYGVPIESVTEFCYLGRILTVIDDDWPEVVGNLRKAEKSWGRLAKVLSREGADPKVSWAFYIAVTQAVLLFGSETWVLMRRMEKAPGHFSVQRRAEAHGEASATQEGRERSYMVLHFIGGSNEGGRDCPDTDVNPPEAEYGRAIYCDAADSGPVQKGHQATGGAGSPAVVRTDRD